MKQLLLPNDIYSSACIDGLLVDNVAAAAQFLTDNDCIIQILHKNVIKLLNAQLIPAKYSHSEEEFDFLILAIFTKEELEDLAVAEEEGLKLEVLTEMLSGATSKEALIEWDL